MNLNKKLQSFINLYVNDPETHGNAYKSAMKAGYSQSYSKAFAHKLCEKVGQNIKEMQQEQKERITLSKDKKLTIMEQDIAFYTKQINDLTIKAQADDEDGKIKGNIGKLISKRTQLLKEHGELAGDYINKQEITQETKLQITQEQQDYIDSRIRDTRLKGNDN